MIYDPNMWNIYVLTKRKTTTIKHHTAKEKERDNRTWKKKIWSQKPIKFEILKKENQSLISKTQTTSMTEAWGRQRWGWRLELIEMMIGMMWGCRPLNLALSEEREREREREMSEERENLK